LSSTEAEYIGLTIAIKEALWFKQMTEELHRKCDKITIYCDNKSTICLSKNPEFHSRSKHIDIRYFIRDIVQKQICEIQYLKTEDMCADILTKGLPMIKHHHCMKLINLSN